MSTTRLLGINRIIIIIFVGRLFPPSRPHCCVGREIVQTYDVVSFSPLESPLPSLKAFSNAIVPGLNETSLPRKPRYLIYRRAFSLGFVWRLATGLTRISAVYQSCSLVKSPCQPVECEMLKNLHL
ncbi:unnamed protein product [Clavelina lepadiformis]|uniref:Secreted protein n=1 Tax=Clavelina lepadiformis TaxID=159417 RepID=A0ABP0H799_CLALP